MIFEKILTRVVLVCILTPFPVLAETSHPLSLQQQLPSFEESHAYQQYLLRPYSEQSKLIYLIDRYSESDITIIYGRYRINTKLAARVARWFLGQNYKGHTAEEWILQWCYRTVPSGELIWVEMADGKKYQSKEVLFAELETLRWKQFSSSDSKASST